MAEGRQVEAASLEEAKCGVGGGPRKGLRTPVIFHSGHKETAKVIFAL